MEELWVVVFLLIPSFVRSLNLRILFQNSLFFSFLTFLSQIFNNFLLPLNRMDIFDRILRPNKFSLIIDLPSNLKPKSSSEQCNNQIFIIAIPHKNLNFLSIVPFIQDHIWYGHVIGVSDFVNKIKKGIYLLEIDLVKRYIWFFLNSQILFLLYFYSWFFVLHQILKHLPLSRIGLLHWFVIFISLWFFGLLYWKYGHHLQYIFRLDLGQLHIWIFKFISQRLPHFQVELR